MRILLVEDNTELSGLLKTYLEKKGCQVYCAFCGESAVDWLGSEQADLVLLDIMLPGLDGFAVCKAIRLKQNLPILMLSARGSKTDKLMGFELGADDYIEKPVDPDILFAKIKALVGRGKDSSLLLQSGRICIDQDAHKVFLDNDVLELNVKEYELLLLLVKNEGKTLHKEFVFNQVWGADSESENQTVTVHIRMLREKIERCGGVAKCIQTVWGIGYRYEKI